MDESWMLPQEAMEFVLEHVERGSVVVEFGSGHGSEVLSEHFDLYSFEHDEAWLGVASSTYIHAPIVENKHAAEAGEKGWYDLDIVRQHWPENPRCVIVDGPPGSIGRTGVLSMLDKLASVPLILVDDVDRAEEMRVCTVLSKRLNFDQTIHLVNKPRKNGSQRRFAVLSRGG